MKKFPLFFFLLSILSATFGFGAEGPTFCLSSMTSDGVPLVQVSPNGRQCKPCVLTPNLDRRRPPGSTSAGAMGVRFVPRPLFPANRFSSGLYLCRSERSRQCEEGNSKGGPDHGGRSVKAGYAQLWGKWGYGGSEDMQNPTLDNIQTLPTSHGYQFVVAELHHPGSYFLSALWNAPAKPGAKAGLELRPNSMAKYKNNKTYPDYPASQNHPAYPKVAYCDSVYAFAALDFVRKQALNSINRANPSLACSPADSSRSFQGSGETSIGT